MNYTPLSRRRSVTPGRLMVSLCLPAGLLSLAIAGVRAVLAIALATGSFFAAPAPTELYTLSLHDALPICADQLAMGPGGDHLAFHEQDDLVVEGEVVDRKSTRLNSSHRCISYAVFCLKKKKKNRS